MSTLSTALGTVALTLAGLGLQAEDFSSLAPVAKSIWPEKNHIGVICDYRDSKAQVEDLARAVGPGSRITVVDIRRDEQAQSGAKIIANRHADFLVLLPKDRVVSDGSFGATLAIHRLAQYGVPSVGTHPKALAQGAVFSMGNATQGEILVTNRLRGTVDVILPPGIGYSQKASLSLQGGMATIAVLAAK